MVKQVNKELVVNQGRKVLPVPLVPLDYQDLLET